MNAILGIYRNSINFLYSHFYILFIIVPIQTIYTFSIKSRYSYLDIFSILPPITTFYRLTIVSLYRHIYTKYIWITYNITYKGSLDFGIPGVYVMLCPHNNQPINIKTAFGVTFPRLFGRHCHLLLSRLGCSCCICDSNGLKF